MAMTSNEETNLIRELQQQNREAQKRLYIRYVGKLMAVCMRYIAHQEDCKDVLQDIFIRIFTSVTSFVYRGNGSLEAWMTRIAVHECLNFLKKKGRLQSLILVQEDFRNESEYLEVPFPELERIPEQILQDLICELPPGYRTVLNLYVFEEKSHKEIAEMLHITEKTSSSQLYKAKNLLGKWIKKYKKQNAYG